MSERNPIDTFYEPTSIAIIGAKNRASGFGARLPGFLLDIGVASERLHLVNPREKEIEGLPVYPTVRDVPVDVDLAIVIVPAPAVAGVLGDCAEKRVKVVNVQSAGFAETGADGAKAQTSSRNRTPRCARLTSPGRGTRPPPTSPAVEMV